MLVLSRKENEGIAIGTDVEVFLLSIKGDKARIGIRAPVEVSVDRVEVRERKLQEAKEKVSINEG